MSKKLDILDQTWKSDALEDFIRRMLVYYDPMELIVLGAPYDEYDNDIGKIKEIVLRDEIDIQTLSEEFFNLFKSKGTDEDILKRKSHRMAEDLIDLRYG